MMGHPVYHVMLGLSEQTHQIQCQPMNLNESRIVAVRRYPLPDPGGIDAAWEYPSEAEALLALGTWVNAGFSGEPTGWQRSWPPYFRRRTADGTEVLRR